LRPFAELVSIGRVVRPQGRRGELLVAPLTDRPERFPGLRHAFLETPDGGADERGVELCWVRKDRYVLKLAGVDSIDDAERLRGRLLAIGEEELAPLPEGCYYHHQLKGLAAQDAAGRDLGSVVDVMETGGVPNLVLRGPEGESLVPLAVEYVREVDLAAGRIVLAPPVWETEPVAASARR
jgi:16S rRNA processing protein RimM